MTATAEILTAINQAYGSASSKACIAAICEGEGGISWNTLFGSGTLLQPTANVQVSSTGRFWAGSVAAFPTWGGAQLSDGSVTHASGASQFEPASWAGIAQVSGRSDFSPQSQIQNTWDLANQVFSSRSSMSLHDVLNVGGSDLNLIPQYLISIWPGGCNSGFPERYANNLPLVTATSSLAVRKIARETAILW